jgi:hypothetical protein
MHASDATEGTPAKLRIDIYAYVNTFNLVLLKVRYTGLGANKRLHSRQKAMLTVARPFPPQLCFVFFCRLSNALALDSSVQGVCVCN